MNPEKLLVAAGPTTPFQRVAHPFCAAQKILKPTIRGPRMSDVPKEET